jgi:hypothetical protein
MSTFNVRELLSRSGHTAGPAGFDAERVSQTLRMCYESVVHLCEPSNRRDDCVKLASGWLKVLDAVPHLDNEELAEARAAVDAERVIGGAFLPQNILAALEAERARGIEHPPLNFICAVEKAIDDEIDRRELLLGETIPKAEAWPMPISSAAELGACKRISADGRIASLKSMLCSENAEHFLAEHHYDDSEDADIARVWLYIAPHVGNLPDDEFEAFRAAAEDLEEMFISYRHPNSILALMSVAIKAELPRRRWNVFIAVMLARERLRATEAPELPPLAQGLAEMASRPLEKVADASITAA